MTSSSPSSSVGASAGPTYERRMVARALRFDDLTTGLATVAVVTASFPHTALAFMRTLERAAPYAVPLVLVLVWLGWRGPRAPKARAALRVIRRSGVPQLVLAGVLAVALFAVGRSDNAPTWWWVVSLAAFLAAAWWLHRVRTAAALAIVAD